MNGECGISATYSAVGERSGSNEPLIREVGIDMSGRRPLIKGYFAVLRLIVDAVMSSACLMRVMTPVGPDVVR